MNAAEPPVRVAALLAGAGREPRIMDCRPLANGGNNKAWRIRTDGGEYVAKQYFRHADDKRDRLSAEFEFMRYASALAPDRVPAPIAADAGDGIAIYSFVPGLAFCPGQVGQAEISAAAEFFASINGPARLSRARHLLDAAESRFSIAGHLALIRRRIEQLVEALSQAPEQEDARALTNALWKRWLSLEREVLLSAVDELRINPHAELPPENRCVSPSDFGFHNALRDDAGTIRFLDFEYAGWDDPAKMAGDFFAQLAVPVPGGYFDEFLSAALDGFPNPTELILRAHLLRPVYQIKWCCIALNVFLPVHLARRKFAHPGLGEHELKQAQLAKAAALFQSIATFEHGLH